MSLVLSGDSPSFSGTYQGGVITSGTAQATTSGTSIDFTSIPSWVKRITVMLNGVSTNGSSFPQIQLGSGSIQTTGYACTAGNSPNGLSPGISTASTGFITEGGTAMNVPGTLRSGSIRLHNISGNNWVADGVIANTAFTNVGYTGGNVSLVGALDCIRLTTVNGTDTFDAGSVNILYE